MAAEKTFRTALRGFNREDVVRYIEYITNKHNSQIAQLNNQLKTAQDELAQLTAKTGSDTPEVQNTVIPESGELEAYRRAERAEREAKERAAQIYAQANAVLSDVTLKIDTAATEMTARMQSWVEAVEDARTALQDAAAAMYTIRPED